MAGFYGIIKNGLEKINNRISNSIDLLDNHLHKKFYNNNYCLEVSYRENNPLNGNRYYEDKNFIALFHGDFVDNTEIPWKDIILSSQQNNYNFFANLSGVFSLAIYNKISNNLKLISDKRAQDPLYYYHDDHQFIFSTELATFCRLLNVEFNQEWLYEYYFYNFAVSKVTPIKNVYRMEYADILNYTKSGIAMSKHSNIFKAEDNLLTGGKALKEAGIVFKERIPKYYNSSNKIGCALTGGWDARTSLAYAPNFNNVVTYTYGIKGCRDLIIASDFAKRTNLKHEKIEFDNDFVYDLPKLMMDSVWLSSGFNNIGRASLSVVYKKIGAMRLNNVITGIATSDVMRGHFPNPGSISDYFADLLMNSETSIPENVFKSNYFSKYIKKSIELLVDKIGDYNKESTHFNTILYLFNANHFAGEIKIADNWLNLRVPIWDNEIIKYLYSSSYSALKFSQYGKHRRGAWPEPLLQAYLLKKQNRDFSKIPVGHLTPNWVLKGKSLSFVNKVANFIIHRIKYPEMDKTPIENNERWINYIHKDFIDQLIFTKKSNINVFFTEKYLRDLKFSRNINQIMKLATVEIINRLVENGWDKNKISLET